MMRELSSPLLAGYLLNSDVARQDDWRAVAVPDTPPDLDWDRHLRGMPPPLLWVRSQVTGLRHLLEVPAPLRPLADALLAGEEPHLTEAERAALVDLELLYPRHELAHRHERWRAHLSEQRQLLKEQEYAVLRGLFPPALPAQLGAYLSRVPLSLEVGDRAASHREVAHNDPLLRLMHFQILPLVQALTPEQILPSYCYVARHLPGAALLRHTDRPQCAWNVSLTLDTAPRRPLAEAWPIYVETPLGVSPILAAPGDAIVYRGTKLPHWREQLPAVYQTYTVCFFHFVPQGFAGSLR